MKHENTTPAELLRAQVDFICQSKPFSTAEQLCAILRYLVSETLEGRGETIKAYNIAVDVLERRSDFDPGTDSIVRAQIHRLRTKLKSYYAHEGKDAEIRIEIPLNHYQPRFSRLRAEEREDRPNPELAVHLSWRPTILVMPLVNQTPESGYAHFSEGLAERLAVALSKFQDIDVISYYPDSFYSHSLLGEGPPQPAARFVLSGSYKVLGARMRVRVTLSDTQHHKILWAEVMDLELEADNWFLLEDKILHNVLPFIAGDHGLISQYMLREYKYKNPENLEIYGAVLRYYNFTRKLNMETYQEAVGALETCLQRYEFCPAMVYAALAELYISDFKLAIDSVPDALSKAEGLINKAFELDYSLQAAHLSMANLCFARRNKEELDIYVDNVIDLNPNNYPSVSIALDWYARSGNLEEGCARLEALYENLKETLPYHHYIAFFLYYYRKGEYGQALKYCYYPGHAVFEDIIDYYAVIVHTLLQNPKDIARYLERIAQHSVDRRGKIARILRAISFYDDLNAEFIDILSRYGLT